MNCVRRLRARARRLSQLALVAAPGWLLACGGGGSRGPAIVSPPRELSLGPQTCVAGRAAEFACQGLDLARRIPHAALGGGAGNDIWGWVDPATGREYALVGRTNGTAFVDISDPLAPVYVGNLPTQTVSSTWRDIKVFDNYAFVVADGAGNHGMQVFDLTLLRNAVVPQVFIPSTVYSGIANAHNLAINETSGFAYAVGTNTCSEGLHMIDISTPINPTFAGCGEFGDTHDAQCVSYAGPDLDYAGREICIDSDSDRVSIVDVTVKAAPVLISSLTYPDLGFVHQGWLTEDRRYFLLGDELDELTFGHSTRTHIIDVTDLDQPTYIGPFNGRAGSTDHNLYVRGERVFEANYTSGLQILEFVDLANATLMEVASFDTFPTNDSAGFSGAWSVYPYFPSGVIVVNDTDTGFFVLTLQ